jgi:hypothetical protein
MSGRLFLTTLIGLMVLMAVDADAKTRWRLMEAAREPGRACVTIGGEAVAYCRLDADEPAVVRVKGPRRLKIVSRYLFGEGEDDSANYRLNVAIDGEPRFEKPERSSTVGGLQTCDDGGRVGALRRSYVSVPSGWHDVQVTSEAPDGGVIAARFLRELKSKPIRWISYAPERFAGVGHLQFDSGQRSTYYRFDDVQPLAFKMSGPSTIEVWTRLDFDHTMSGTQPYGLEVMLDGEPWRTFHFDSTKLASAAWIERPSVLPGQRKTMRLKIPSGTHRIEIHCLKPEACGLAAKIRIPERDIR